MSARSVTIGILLLFSAGLFYGTLVHWVQLVGLGWQPRPQFGIPANVIWTSLAILDPLALSLLWPLRTRRAGVILTLLIVALDVPLNLWAQRRTGTQWPLGGIAQPLMAFAVVAVAGAPVLWRSRVRGGRPQQFHADSSSPRPMLRDWP